MLQVDWRISGSASGSRRPLKVGCSAAKRLWAPELTDKLDLFFMIFQGKQQAGAVLPRDFLPR